MYNATIRFGDDCVVQLTGLSSTGSSIGDVVGTVTFIEDGEPHVLNLVLSDEDPEPDIPIE